MGARDCDGGPLARDSLHRPTCFPHEAMGVLHIFVSHVYGHSYGAGHHPLATCIIPIVTGIGRSHHFSKSHCTNGRARLQATLGCFTPLCVLGSAWGGNMFWSL